MARINVDQKALTDPRFDILARLMGKDDRDSALGKMVRVWNECTERETPTPPRSIVNAIFNDENACAWLVQSELAEPIDETTIRIKGASGRIEWLSIKRRNGKKYGHLGGSFGGKGGRPRAGGKKPPLGVTQNPPPAPAPAPAIKETPIPPALDTPQFRAAWIAWEAHRREIKKPLKPTSASLQLKKLAQMGMARAVRCIEHTIEKSWIGLREPDGAETPEPTKQRPATAFEVAHGRYNPQTGFERDAAGNIILDRLCKDAACDHCKARRGGVA